MSTKRGEPMFMSQGLTKKAFGDEIGRPGLARSGGYIQDEFVRALQGQKGAKAYREMADNSALVAGLLLLWKTTVSATPSRIEPYVDAQGAKPKAEDKRRAEFVAECMDDMTRSWQDVFSEVLTVLEYGWSALEVTYKKRAGYKPDQMASSQYNDGMIGWASWSLRAQESLSRWEYDEATGKVIGLYQQPAPDYIERLIPLDKLLHFRTTTEKDNPEGRSILRAAWWDYTYAKKLTELAGIQAERDITGIPVMRIPGVALTSDATASQASVKTYAKNIIENIRNDEQAGIILPSDRDPETKDFLYDFSLLGSPGSKQTDLSERIKHHETRMAMALAADWIMFGHENVGSFALTSNRTDLWAAILDGFLTRIDETINQQAIPRLALLNGWPMDRLPYRAHGQVSKVKAEALGTAVKAYVDAGGILDPKLDAYVREVNGWPEADMSDLALPKPPVDEPPAPPAPPAPAPKPDAEPGGSAADPASDEQDDAEDAAEDELDVDKAAHQPRARLGTFAPNSGSVTAALDLLAARQRVGGGDAISHGFPVVSDPPFRLDRDYRDEIEGADIEDVDLKSLKATNVNVRRNGVKAFIERPMLVTPGKRTDAGVLEDMPVVFEVDDERVLYDGHHRAVAARLMGDATIRARVVRAFEKAVYLRESPPWRVDERAGKYAVVVVETGEVVGEHDSQADALKHLRALYANAMQEERPSGTRGRKSKRYQALEAGVAEIDAQVG